jgi:hypothetical protein
MCGAQMSPQEVELVDRHAPDVLGAKKQPKWSSG